MNSTRQIGVIVLMASLAAGCKRGTTDEPDAEIPTLDVTTWTDKTELAGSEIQTPMAIVILCGLMTSTLLNMVVVPTMYLRYGRPVPRFAPSPRPAQSEG